MRTMTHNVNTPLLRKTLEHITAHPEEHAQGLWAKRTACGTACCVAGWAVQFTGHDLLFDLNGDAEHVVTADGDVVSISEIAEQELGLTERQSEKLFCGGNSVAILYTLANKFTEGEIEIPETYLG